MNFDTIQRLEQSLHSQHMVGVHDTRLWHVVLCCCLLHWNPWASLKFVRVTPFSYAGVFKQNSINIWRYKAVIYHHTIQSHPWSDCASLLAAEFDIFDQPFYNALLCQPAVSWSEFHHDLLLIHDALARSASWQLQALCWASASTSKTRQPPARYQNAPSTTQTTS